MFPCVEHLRLESITVGEYGNVIVLVARVQGLESLVVPLVDRDFLLEFPQFVDDHVKGLQFLVAILIELRVLNQLFERGFFAVADALLQVPENYLGDDQFGVLVVVSSHVPSLAGYVPHAIIIRNCQPLQICEDVGPFCLQAGHLRLQVNILVVDVSGLVVESVKFQIDRVEIFDDGYSVLRHKVHLFDFALHIIHIMVSLVL